MKMFLTDVLINAVNPAFEYREVSLGSVRRGVATNVFLLRVVDGAVTGEPLASFPVDAALVMRRCQATSISASSMGRKFAAVTSGT